MLLPWESRAIYGLIRRKVTRAGVLDLEGAGARAVSVMINIPLHVVEPGLEGLRLSGWINMTDKLLQLPDFIPSEETPSSNAQRQRESRAKAADRAQTEIAAAHESVTISTQPELPYVVAPTQVSRFVTSGRDPVSTGREVVTPCRTVPSVQVDQQRACSARARDPRSAGPDLIQELVQEVQLERPVEPDPPAPPEPEVVTPEPEQAERAERASPWERLWAHYEALRLAFGLPPRGWVPGDEQRVLALLANADEATIRGWLDAIAHECRGDPSKVGKLLDGKHTWMPGYLSGAVSLRAAGAAPPPAPARARHGPPTSRGLSVGELIDFATHARSQGL
jgi:hypothetical protein